MSDETSRREFLGLAGAATIGALASKANAQGADILPIPDIPDGLRGKMALLGNGVYDTHINQNAGSVKIDILRMIWAEEYRAAAMEEGIALDNVIYERRANDIHNNYKAGKEEQRDDPPPTKKRRVLQFLEQVGLDIVRPSFPNAARYERGRIEQEERNRQIDRQRERRQNDDAYGNNQSRTRRNDAAAGKYRKAADARINDLVFSYITLLGFDDLNAKDFARVELAYKQDLETIRQNVALTLKRDRKRSSVEPASPEPDTQTASSPSELNARAASLESAGKPDLPNPAREGRRDFLSRLTGTPRGPQRS